MKDGYSGYKYGDAVVLRWSGILPVGAWCDQFHPLRFTPPSASPSPAPFPPRFTSWSSNWLNNSAVSTIACRSPLSAGSPARPLVVFGRAYPVLIFYLAFVQSRASCRDVEKLSDAIHRSRRTRAMASTKAGAGLAYQAAVRWVIGRCSCSEWEARVIQENSPIRTGVVRPDHWRWVSTPR